MHTADANKPAEIAIVGAGAAGLATAIFAASRIPAARIIAIDSARKPGAKILVSGGGRCNVTNVVVTADDFHGTSRNTIRRILRAFPADAAVAFFQDIGVNLREEPHGKLFPTTNKAATVLDALLAAARNTGVILHTGCRVESIQRTGNVFNIQTAGPPMQSRRVVLATGGLSLPKTGSDGHGYRIAQSLGHTVTATTPALAPLILDGGFHQPLSGISHDVQLLVRINGRLSERLIGSLLWTHFGVSGPVVLDASRHWHHARLHQQEVTFALNMLPQYDPAQVDLLFRDFAADQPRFSVRQAIAQKLPARVADAVLDCLHIDGATALCHLSRDNRRKLLLALQDWPLPVRDSRGYAYAEVTAGGVPLDEINPSTMESRKCPGLYLVGEILDVDGRIGGFNFQWAWSTASTAASGMAQLNND